MVELVAKRIKLYNPETKQHEYIDALRGESAYEAAKRLGMTTLTEEEWIAEQAKLINEIDKLKKPLINYLQNSDFTQFVAQAGLAVQHVLKVLYLGDRWRLYYGSSDNPYVVNGEMNVNGNGYKNVYLKGTTVQIVENPPRVGYAYVTTLSGTATAKYDYDETTNSGVVTIDSKDGCVLDQAWLYDTPSDTPPVRKGYTAELMDCYRYFIQFNQSNALSFSGYSQNSTTARFTIPLPVPMRMSNPSYRISYLHNLNIMPNSITTDAVTSLVVSGNTACIELHTTSNMTAGIPLTLKTNTPIQLCADLEEGIYA